MPRLPIGKDDVALDLGPGRDKRLPTIYRTPKHPKCKGPGRIFYFIQDLSKDALRRTSLIEKTIKIPHGTHQDALDRGFLHLQEDDIVFVRGLSSPASGVADVPCCWVTGQRIFTRVQLENMRNARDRCLGDRKLRSREAPKKVNGEMVGGTAFERNGRAFPVVVHTRCYGVGNSAEPSSGLMAPHKGNKVLGGWDRDGLEMREELVKAGAPLGVRSMKEGPDDVLTHLKLNAELLNLPKMGHEENVAYFAAQLNIAPAQPHSSGVTLSDAMGEFGGEHSDDGDNPSYYTWMTAISDLPDGYDPGRFFILFPGVFITLVNFACINFCGLRMHGGTAPIAPPDADPLALQWATRFTFIMYPPTRATSGNQRYVIGGLPMQKEFIVPCDVIKMEEISRLERGWCSHATYAEDGHVVQSRRAHCDFVVRCLYSMVLYIILQMPESYRILIDMDTFMSSFSFVDEEGDRWTLGAWLKGPGHRCLPLSTSQPPSTNFPMQNEGSASQPGDHLSCPSSSSSSSLDADEHIGSRKIDESMFVSQTSVRQLAKDQWLWYYNYTASHIPSATSRHCNLPTIAEYPAEFSVTVGGLDDAENGEDEAGDTESEIEDLPCPQIVALGGRPANKGGSSSKKVNTRTSGEVNLDNNGSRVRKKAKKDNSFIENNLQTDDTTNIQLICDTEPLRAAVSQGMIQPGVLSTHTPACLTQSATVAQKARGGLTATFLPGQPWNTNAECIEHQASSSAKSGNIAQHAPNIPRFLAEMTLEKLTDELNNVKDSIAETLASGHAHNERLLLQSIQQLHSTIINKPLGADTLANISLSWEALQVHDVQSHSSTLLLRNQHATSMLYNYTIWNWLDVHFSRAANLTLQGEDLNVDEWISKLVRSVQEMYELQIQTRTFIAIAYAVPLPGVEYTKTHTLPWPRTAKTIQSAIIKAVVEIVQHWLAFPEQQYGRSRAWFAHAIISQFGLGILFLDHIWDTYAQVTPTFFRQGIWKINSFADMKLLIDLAPSHSLFNPRSPERLVVQELANLIHGFAAGQIMLQTPKATPPTNVATSADRLPIQLQSPTAKKMDLFRNFVCDSVSFLVMSDTNLAAIHPTIANATPIYPRLRAAMLQRPDFVIPFREVAPGRIRFSQPDGPYHPSVVRTTKGIYSAILWRAVTFNAPFASTGPKMFNSYADFKYACDCVKPQPADYFCNKAAYGVHDPGRNVENAKAYWNTLQNNLWPNFVGIRMLSFKETYEFFSYRQTGTGGTRFSHLGPLGSYLITADLVYAGIVYPPTNFDIGWAVCHLNKGAVSGLIELGLLSPPPLHLKSKKRPKPMQKGCEEGISQVLQVMLDIVPSELLAYLIVDPITVEHALCKFSRALKRSWLQ